MKHKHDWHCGGIERLTKGVFGLRFLSFILGYWRSKFYVSKWACSICGAVKELKSKEVIK